MPHAPFVFPNDAHDQWSIMIVLYPYITGLVAGSFVVASLYHVFHQDVFKPVARLSLVTALCFCAFATLPLLLHLHHPERALNIMITPSASSAMAGFGFIYNFYLLLLLVEVWLVFRPVIIENAQRHHGVKSLCFRILALGPLEYTQGARRVDERAVRVLSVIGIPAACVLHGYVGFLFGGVKANPWWSTALMPVIFLASAVASGIAALIVLYICLSRRRGIVPNGDCVRALSLYLWGALMLAVTLEMLELGHMWYESGEEWNVISILVTQHLSTSYWIVQVLVGSIVPFFLLMIATRPSLAVPRRVTLSAIASVLVLIQVLAMRWNVVVGGQLFSKSFRGFVKYPVDFGGREGLAVAAVILILPVLALWIADRVLPLWPTEAHGSGNGLVPSLGHPFAAPTASQAVDS